MQQRKFTSETLEAALQKFNISTECCDVFEETLLKLIDVEQQSARSQFRINDTDVTIEYDIACSPEELIDKINAHFPRLAAEQGCLGDLYPEFKNTGLLSRIGKNGSCKYITMSIDHIEEDLMPAILNYLSNNPEIAQKYADQTASKIKSEAEENKTTAASSPVSQANYASMFKPAKVEDPVEVAKKIPESKPRFKFGCVIL